MTILCDWQISDRCKVANMIEPYTPEQVNPASYDVAIGVKLLLETLEYGWKEYDLREYNKHEPFILHPGDCVLVETKETFSIPIDLCAQFRLKSSRGREFYEHMEAGFCDPGWHGSKLTMELKNNLKFGSLPLYPGLLIGQMVFQKLDAIPFKPYNITGRYNNDTSVKRSKG